MHANYAKNFFVNFSIRDLHPPPKKCMRFTPKKVHDLRFFLHVTDAFLRSTTPRQKHSTRNKSAKAFFPNDRSQRHAPRSPYYGCPTPGTCICAPPTNSRPSYSWSDSPPYHGWQPRPTLEPSFPNNPTHSHCSPPIPRKQCPGTYRSISKKGIPHHTLPEHCIDLQNLCSRLRDWDTTSHTHLEGMTCALCAQMVCAEHWQEKGVHETSVPNSPQRSATPATSREQQCTYRVTPSTRSSLTLG